ncbi:MAG: hypothetical protein J7497_05335 [Chitinophagaceae bacterium]|nr:hypothetical protein [Chitinophagaceae bacterium]
MKVIQNAWMEFVRGSIKGSPNFRMVVRQYKKGAVMSTYPRKKKIKTSGKQSESQPAFKEAVLHAQDIIHDPERKKAFAAKLEPGASVYHAAIREYMEKFKAGKENE